MSLLLLLLLAIFVAVGLIWGLAWRHGLAPHWPPGSRAPYPVEVEHDDGRGGFESDFGPKRERPPGEADGPGWDS